MLNIVLIEDDPLIQGSMKMLLKNHRLEMFENSHDFVHQFDGKSMDLILMDLCSPRDPEGKESLNYISEIRHRFPRVEIVIQSGLSDVALMRSCIQRGATRYILKDHMADELPVFIGRFEEIVSQRKKIDELILGNSDVMRRLKDELSNLRLYTSVDVLVEGETGSGKELCAKALHMEGPFIAVNASAIPADLFESEFFGSEKGAFTGSVQMRIGYFEAVGTGTLFIDEIQNISEAHQAKLLRVLESRTFKRVGSHQDRPFRGRVVTASNRNLLELIEKGQFREDLYYRIGTVRVRVPPLRVRGEDIPDLAQHFLRDFDVTQKKSFTQEGLRFLSLGYDWPGNVRELRNLVRRIAIQNPIPKIDVPELQALLAQDEKSWHEPSAYIPQNDDLFKDSDERSFDDNVQAFEKYLLEKALRQHTTTKAREKLGLARSRFYEKLKQYSLLNKTPNEEKDPS